MVLKPFLIAADKTAYKKTKRAELRENFNELKELLKTTNRVANLCTDESVLFAAVRHLCGIDLKCRNLPRSAKRQEGAPYNEIKRTETITRVARHNMAFGELRGYIRKHKLGTTRQRENLSNLNVLNIIIDCIRYGEPPKEAPEPEQSPTATTTPSSTPPPTPTPNPILVHTPTPSPNAIPIRPAPILPYPIIPIPVFQLPTLPIFPIDTPLDPTALLLYLQQLNATIQQFQFELPQPPNN